MSTRTMYATAPGVTQLGPRKLRALDIDALLRYSAAAYRRAGRPGDVAKATGVHKSQGTRYQQGVVTAPFSRTLIALAEHPDTRAWPLITEALATVTQHEIRTEPTHALHVRRAELEHAEFDLRRDLDHARYAGAPLRDLRARMADLSVELLAIENELDEREKKGGK